jgi:hypothetical protein
VVLGSFDAAGLAGVARLQFASGAVQPVLAGADGTILVGTARVVAGNIPAANGVLHIIDDVLDDDISLNSTAVVVAENAGDFGPFNQTQASLLPPALSSHVACLSMPVLTVCNGCLVAAEGPDIHVRNHIPAGNSAESEGVLSAGPHDCRVRLP